MPFLEHLEELRGALLASAFAVVLTSSAAWFVSGPVLEFLIRPVEGGLIFLSPTEAFTTRVKVAFVLGILLALPYVLHRAWRFVLPALYRREANALRMLVFGSTTLFLLGLALAYVGVVPVAIRFLLGFGTHSLRPMLTAGQYFGFVSKVCLGFGIVFQLPLVLSVLAWFGMVSSQGLLRKWRLGILIIVIVAAILTPPDVASQLLMAIPVVGLYFLSIVLVRRIEGRRSRGSSLVVFF